MTLWNEMMLGLEETTNLDINQLAQRTAGASGIDVSLSRGSALSQANQSQLSQSKYFRRCLTSMGVVSIKDDARDLLEKYSQALIEQIKTSMAAEQQRK